MCSDHRGFPDLAELIDGYQRSALVYAAVRLGLADAMGSQRWTPENLAPKLAARPDPLGRLLRGLAAVGVCDEDDAGRFGLSEAGRQLRSESASGLREKTLLAVEHYWPAWTALAESVHCGRTAFGEAFGIDVWQYRRDHPALDATFNAWLMKETASASAAIVPAIDVGEARRVADIGGGRGGLLFPLLEKHPRLTGILFDQEHVLDAQPANDRHRVELVAGDFFAAVPVQADLFLLKSVIHDWDDSAAIQILGNCRAAMGPGSRLIVIERDLPVLAAQRPDATLLDVHMMAVTGGRERTMDQLVRLLDAAGLAVSRVSRCLSGHSLIEALPR